MEPRERRLNRGFRRTPASRGRPRSLPLSRPALRVLPCDVTIHTGARKTGYNVPAGSPGHACGLPLFFQAIARCIFTILHPEVTRRAGAATGSTVRSSSGRHRRIPRASDGTDLALSGEEIRMKHSTCIRAPPAQYVVKPQGNRRARAFKRGILSGGMRQRPCLRRE